MTDCPDNNTAEGNGAERSDHVAGRGSSGGSPENNTGSSGGSLDNNWAVLGIQQVAIGGDSLAALRSLWVDTLGVTKTGGYTAESENVNEDILTLGSGPHAVEIDLMEPLDPEGRPKVNTPPLNHIGLWVDDLATAVAQLTEQGMRFAPGGIRKGAAGHDVCFIHPKANGEFPLSGEGVLIELVQAPANVISALS